MFKLVGIGLFLALVVLLPEMVLAQAVVPGTVVPVTVPVTVAPAAGSVINVGGVFGPIIEPYVNSIVGAMLSALCAWIMWLIKTKLGVNIDQAQADVYLRAAKNQASALVAGGFVQIAEHGKVTVNSAALAGAANDLLSSVPDAASHFTLQNRPDDVAAKIVAMIPQVPAAAAAVSAATTVAAAADEAAAQVAAKT